MRRKTVGAAEFAGELALVGEAGEQADSGTGRYCFWSGRDWGEIGKFGARVAAIPMEERKCCELVCC